MQNHSAKTVHPFYIFLSWRLLLSILATLFSSLRPSTPIEQYISIWPPANDIGLWLNRVFLAPWLRWDAVWYVHLLTTGYAAGDGSTSFHPLYILLSKPLSLIGFEPALSLMIINTLACMGIFWVYYRLASLDLPPETSQLALVLLSVFPVSFILFAPYTESVFLFFVVLALYQLRKRNWFFASLATCLAGLARQQGVFLLFPMLWYIWEDSGKSINGLVKVWRGWLATLSTPLGLFLWAIYRIGYLHEGTLNTQTWEGFVYSILLSPSAKKIIPDQTLLWPGTAFINAVIRVITLRQPQGMINIILGLGFIILFAWAWKYLLPADRIYCLAITLISFSMSTGSVNTYVYLSLPRHLLVALPVFMGLARALKKPWQQIVLISLQFPIQVFMLYLYVSQAWIP